MVGEGPFTFPALAVVDRLPMALIPVGAWKTDATAAAAGRASTGRSSAVTA
jgi:hypothetical protein